MSAVNILYNGKQNTTIKFFNHLCSLLILGNALINVGPTKEGTIIPIFQERLLALGEWLSINGKAIYSSSPWHSQNDTLDGHVWYTCTKATYNASYPTATPTKDDTITAIYAIILEWPEKSLLRVRDITPYLHSGTYKVEMLGNEGQYLTVSKY